VDLHEAYDKVVTKLFELVPDIKDQPGIFHDVTPVLEVILEKLNYSLQWDETYSAIGETELLVQRQTKRHPLFVLPVPMQQGMLLQTLIEQALATEEVHDENNRWNEALTHDGEKYPLADYCTKHTLVEPLPDMLVIQLKRWKWDELAMDLVKDSAEIVCANPINIGSSSYTLKACIQQNHIFMHYHAEVLIQGQWYRCDDTDIAPIAEPESSKAYIFVLEKNQAV
jgi:hypothetical protein